MLSQCELAGSLGHVITDPIKLHRGLPQGAPESPLLFILVCELVLRPLLLRWLTEGKVGSSVNIGLRPWDLLMTIGFSAKTKMTWRRC